MTTGKSAGQRQARSAASPRFKCRAFVNTHPVAPGLKPGVERPTLKDFLRGGEGRVPAGPLPIENPVARRSSFNLRGPKHDFFCGAAGANVRLAMPKLGEPVEPSRLGDVDPWWRSVLGQRVPEPPDGALTTPTESMEWLPD
jgi:hypothetical protein